MNAPLDVLTLPTLNELRHFIRLTLCEMDRLDPIQTPLYEALITRQNKPCGLFFQVRGPRMSANYAIWTGEENRILCYDSKGERLAEYRLLESPDPRQLPFIRRRAG